ncbi:MAG: hypothetical protein R3A10_00050 [Caldilineaceae bacterium]
MVSLTGCGDTIKSCDSDVRVFCTKGILHAGVWGERLEVQRDGSELLKAGGRAHVSRRMGPVRPCAQR